MYLTFKKNVYSLWLEVILYRKNGRYQTMTPILTFQKNIIFILKQKKICNERDGNGLYKTLPLKYGNYK